MTDLEYLEAINMAILTRTVSIFALLIISIRYYRLKMATSEVAILVLIQNILDTLMLPIIAEYRVFGYYWCFIMWSFTATYVVISLFFKVYFKNLKVTIIEYLIVTLELFIVLCMTCRFIDKILLSGAGWSHIFIYISTSAHYLIIFCLFIPTLQKIITNLGLDYFIEKSGIKLAFINIVNFDISRLFAKRGAK